MTVPVDGDVPSFTTASEKYSTPSVPASGDEGAYGWTSLGSLGDLVDRSEGVRPPPVDLPPGDLAVFPILNRGEIPCNPGLMGEVAIGTKNGSTTGLVVAV